MTLNGRYAAIAETMRLSEPTTKIWMKIDPYYQRQKCRPMTVLSGGIRFMRIFTEVPSGVWRRWGCRERQFPAFTLAISSETLELIAICSPSSAFQWSQNAWPWMTVNGYFALNSVRLSKYNYVKTNKDRHIVSATQTFGTDSSFWHYKVCADIRSVSLERRR